MLRRWRGSLLLVIYIILVTTLFNIYPFLSKEPWSLYHLYGAPIVRSLCFILWFKDLLFNITILLYIGLFMDIQLRKLRGKGVVYISASSLLLSLPSLLLTLSTLASDRVFMEQFITLSIYLFYVIVVCLRPLLYSLTPFIYHTGVFSKTLTEYRRYYTSKWYRAIVYYLYYMLVTAIAQVVRMVIDYSLWNNLADKTLIYIYFRDWSSRVLAILYSSGIKRLYSIGEPTWGMLTSEILYIYLFVSILVKLSR